MKIFKFICVVIFIFLIGGIGSVFFQNYIIPKINSSATFSRFGLVKKLSENVTIINKTEEVVVKEENSVNKIATQASAAVVSITSIPEKNKIIGIYPAEIKNGNGVVVTSDGLIATYRSAILEKDSGYEVRLFNGSAFDAKLVGIDEFTNLAFLKIDASNLSVISFSNSNDFVPGRKLIAIGSSPEDYQNRYAGGILSNINKTFNVSGKALSSSEKLEGVFETDFLSQKEYIGGPIIDYNGELVGIIGSVMIDSQEKFFEIPSNVVRNSIDVAVRNELESRPYLGIYYLPITKTYAKINNLEKEKGALVYSSSGKQGLAIIAGSPAEKAGLKINDIIILIDGKEINLENPLSDIISQYKKGSEAEFTVIREKQELKIKVSF